jgi:hypothetical protein
LGIWIDILNAAANGDPVGARILLTRDLPLALSEPVLGPSETGYRGPVPKSVKAFISKLPKSERTLANTWRDDFVDHIVDSVQAGVERTLALVEICAASRFNDLDEIVDIYPWHPGLKRDHQWKRKRIADELRSMIALGIPLPGYILEILGDEGEPLFRFNEIASATAPRRLELSWGDFKKSQQIGDQFLCINDSEDETGVAAEGIDYGSVPMARLVAQISPPTDIEIAADLSDMGSSLSTEITAKMEAMHTTKPSGGYHPIAWHNVFWEVVSEYEVLVLSLEQHVPFCETDQVLADYIVVNYTEVVAASRPSITRRRIKLYGACKDLILARVFRYFEKP